MKELYILSAVIFTVFVVYLLSPVVFDVYDNCQVTSSSTDMNRHNCRTQTYYTQK